MSGTFPPGHSVYVWCKTGSRPPNSNLYLVYSLLTSSVQTDDGPFTRPKHVVVFTYCSYVIFCVNWLNIYIYIYIYIIVLYHYYPNTTGMTHLKILRLVCSNVRQWKLAVGWGRLLFVLCVLTNTYFKVVSYLTIQNLVVIINTASCNMKIVNFIKTVFYYIIKLIWGFSRLKRVRWIVLLVCCPCQRCRHSDYVAIWSLTRLQLPCAEVRELTERR